MLCTRTNSRTWISKSLCCLFLVMNHSWKEYSPFTIFFMAKKKTIFNSLPATCSFTIVSLFLDSFAKEQPFDVCGICFIWLYFLLCESLMHHLPLSSQSSTGSAHQICSNDNHSVSFQPLCPFKFKTGLLSEGGLAAVSSRFSDCRVFF